jgi:putative transposase
VFCTKYRFNWINNGIFAYIELKLTEIRSYYPDILFTSVNHDQNHIHMLLSIPPKHSVGSIVRIIKSNTSRSLRQKFPHLKKLYYKTDGIWSDGYFVSTVGINKEIITKYIEHQGKEDEAQETLELF